MEMDMSEFMTNLLLQEEQEEEEAAAVHDFFASAFPSTVEYGTAEIVVSDGAPLRRLDELIARVTDPEPGLERLTFRKRSGGQNVLSFLPEDPANQEARLLLLRAIAASESLKEVDIRGMELQPCEASVFCHDLRSNHTLQSLIAGDQWTLGDEGAKHFAEMLAANPASLKSLDLWHSGIGVEGARYIGQALGKNTTLQSLKLWDNPLRADGVSALLRPLNPRLAGVATNRALQTLAIGGGHNKMGSEGAKVLARTLAANTTLKTLKLTHEHSLGTPDICEILDALRRNPCLETLDLSYCGAVSGDAVHQAFLDLLAVNTNIRELHLEGTPLFFSGQSIALQAQLRENARTSLQDLPKTRPRFARVFLCGYPFAGKTTLRRSITRLLNAEASHALIKACLASREAVLEHLFGLSQCIGASVLLDTVGRTSGVDIKPAQISDLHISFWDLAGQEEFYAFHDYLMPNQSGKGSPSSFIIVVSAVHRKQGSVTRTRTKNELREDLTYWLRFIGSNSQKSDKFRPFVMVILTHIDQADNPTILLAMEEICDDLQLQFRDYLRLEPDVHQVDARFGSSVKPVIQYVERNLRATLQQLPDVYQVIEKTRLMLEDWNSRNPNQPVILWENFAKLIYEEHLDYLRQKVVATYLHDAGIIIYFEGLDFVIVNPQWFCHELIGRLIRPGCCRDLKTMASSETPGFLRLRTLEKALMASLKKSNISSIDLGNAELTEIRGKDLVDIMLKLGLCCTTDTNNKIEIFVPALLGSGWDEEGTLELRRLKWITTVGKECKKAEGYTYLGRRLECEDKCCTFLTPGFFPHLQVSLWRKLKQMDAVGKSICLLEKNLISILYNGTEILIECENGPSHFVDVLARCSTRGLTKAMEFMKDIVWHIRTLCADPNQGCQGVVLLESVLRTFCVEKLTLLKHRRGQSVLVEDLKRQLLRDLLYRHSWDEVKDGSEVILGYESEPAMGLVGNDVLEVVEQKLDYVHRVHEDVRNLKNFEVDLHHGSHYNSHYNSHHDRSFAKIMRELKKLGELGERLEAKIEGVKMELSEVLPEICNLLDNSMGISVHGQQHAVPCLLSLSGDGVGLPRKLLSKVIPGVKGQIMHFWCEDRISGPHEVPDQPGLEVSVGDQDARKLQSLVLRGLKFINFFIKLLLTPYGLSSTDATMEPRELLQQSLEGINETTLPSEWIKTETTEISGSSGAEQWLVDFLKGKDMTQLFQLHRVVYKKSGKYTDKIAWVCTSHKEKGLSSSTMELLPIW